MTCTRFQHETVSLEASLAVHGRSSRIGTFFPDKWSSRRARRETLVPARWHAGAPLASSSSESPCRCPESRAVATNSFNHSTFIEPKGICEMSTDKWSVQRNRFQGVDEREEGFTLIELLVVLLIIGILLAVAIPTFLTTAKAANATSAQANLQTALTGADSYWTQADQSYSGIDVGGSTTVSNISEIDTNVNYVSGTNSTGLNVVSLWTDDSSSIVLAAYAPGTRDCWFIIDLKAPSSTVWGGLGIGTYYAVDPGVPAGACAAAGTAPSGASTPQTGGFPSA